MFQQRIGRLSIKKNDFFSFLCAFKYGRAFERVPCAMCAAENFPMFKLQIGFYLNFHIKAFCLIEPQFWIICGPGYILFTQSTRRGKIQFNLGKLNATLLEQNVEIFCLFKCDVRWPAVCISFSNNSCVDITYSPPARYSFDTFLTYSFDVFFDILLNMIFHGLLFAFLFPITHV